MNHQTVLSPLYSEWTLVWYVMEQNPTPEPMDTPGISYPGSSYRFFIREGSFVPEFRPIEITHALAIIERASRKAEKKESQRKATHLVEHVDLLGFIDMYPLHSMEWTRKVALQELTRLFGNAAARNIIEEIAAGIKAEAPDENLDTLVSHDPPKAPRDPAPLSILKEADNLLSWINTRKSQAENNFDKWEEEPSVTYGDTDFSAAAVEFGRADTFLEVLG